MFVARTETIQFDGNDVVSSMCHYSKNLFNQANYEIKQGLNEEGKWIRYDKLNGLFKGTTNYGKMPTQSAQQTLKLIDKSWKAFFKAIKDWKKNPHKYFEMPRPPKYKKKNGEHILVFTNQQCKIKEGYVVFPKIMNLKIETRLHDVKLKQVRIVPMGVGYKCEIVYEKEIEKIELDNNRIAGIDLGLTNIVTMANNIGEKPIIIKGNIVKSINQYYNKKLARLKSVSDLHKLGSTNRIKRLHHKRNNKVNDFFHKTSRRIIDWCIEHNIGSIVIGYNEKWKQKSNMGKRNNQKFTQLPFYKLINQLKYKAKDTNITIIEQEESYTSKCSFLDNEPIQKHETYMGKRVHRGLFRSSDNTIINADVNGAYNIMRKAIPNLMEGIEGVALHPMSISHEYS